MRCVTLTLAAQPLVVNRALPTMVRNNGLASLLISSVTGLIGICAVRYYHRKAVQQLKLQCERSVTAKDEQMCALERRVQHVESNNSRLTTALEQSETRYVACERNLQAVTEKKRTVVDERDAAVAERNELSGALHACEQQKQHALAQVRGAEEELRAVRHRLEEVKGALQRSEEQARLVRSENDSLREWVQTLEGDVSSLKALSANKSDEIDTHLRSIAHLNQHITHTGEQQQSRMDSLHQNLSEKEAEVEQLRARMAACERYMEQQDEEHASQLIVCAEKIKAAQRESARVCNELNAFLEKHPRLSIDIALLRRKDRLKAARRAVGA